MQSRPSHSIPSKHSLLYSPSTAMFFQVTVLPSGFPTKSLSVSLLSVTHATCTTHFSPVHLAGSTYVTVLILKLKAIAMTEADAFKTLQT